MEQILSEDDWGLYRGGLPSSYTLTVAGVMILLLVVCHMHSMVY